MEPAPPSKPKTRAWSIYGRTEITSRYNIQSRIGAGSYADVYLATRKSDGIKFALKEIHDYLSSIREIQALQTLRHAPNVVDLIEYFWDEDEDEDAVLVLEYLPLDLEKVIKDGKRNGGIGAGEIKRWMLQVLSGVDDCHRCLIVHRDLKLSNLLISETGVLKLADFGQARTLDESRYISIDNAAAEPDSEYSTLIPQEPPTEEPVKSSIEEDYYRELYDLKSKYATYDTDKDTIVQDGNTSCLATCSSVDIEEDDPFRGESSYSYDESGGGFTSCVGTRWFRAPELLYGSTTYGLEIDLWSLGCVFAELLALDTLFPGTSDLDQLARIINVLGDINEDTWSGCSKLPDYNKISFNKIESPIGLEACLKNRSSSEVNLVKKLLCYDPAKRATAMELMTDGYFSEEPLPVPLNELRVPEKRDDCDESSEEEWGNCNREMESDSDVDEFGKIDVVTTDKGFSLRFL